MPDFQNRTSASVTMLNIYKYIYIYIYSYVPVCMRSAIFFGRRARNEPKSYLTKGNNETSANGIYSKSKSIPVSLKAIFTRERNGSRGRSSFAACDDFSRFQTNANNISKITEQKKNTIRFRKQFYNLYSTKKKKRKTERKKRYIVPQTKFIMHKNNISGGVLYITVCFTLRI